MQEEAKVDQLIFRNYPCSSTRYVLDSLPRIPWRNSKKMMGWFQFGCEAIKERSWEADDDLSDG
jgi:hypothetical protein